MKRDEAMRLAETAIETLSGELAKGHSETLTKYLQTLARFHNYSIGNVMLIAFQRPDATHVAGYRTSSKLGRHVKKGETGIAILAPMVRRPKRDESTTSRALDEDEREQVLRGFKVVHVFDVSQTAGKELPDIGPITGSPGEAIDRLRAVISGHGITLAYAPIPGGAQGVSAGGSIFVRPDLDEGEEFYTLAHELAHELLHKGERRSETTKTIRETEAEAVAFVVSNAIGLETTTRASDYIQLYCGDKKTLSASLDNIQSVSARIIEALKLAA